MGKDELHVNLRIRRSADLVGMKAEKPSTAPRALTGTRTSISGLGNLRSVLLSYEGILKNVMYGKRSANAIQVLLRLESPVT